MGRIAVPHFRDRAEMDAWKEQRRRYWHLMSVGVLLATALFAGLLVIVLLWPQLTPAPK